MNYIILVLLAVNIILLVVIVKLVQKVKCLDFEKGLLSQIVTKD